jgi:formamidopyrimidine-DNA glycosylase
MPEVVEIRHYADFIRRISRHSAIKSIKIWNGRYSSRRELLKARKARRYSSRREPLKANRVRRYKKHAAFPGFASMRRLLPLRVAGVASKGKLLYITLNSAKTQKNYYLLATLGLTGGWVAVNHQKKYIFPRLFAYVPRELRDPYRDISLKHLNIEFSLSGGQIPKLYFFDMLSFGTMSFIPDDGTLERKLRTIGPDIMDLREMNFDLFSKRLRMPANLSKPVGVVLMNQRVISGIGNYLRADILWLARISPHRKIRSLSSRELRGIYRAARLLTWGEYNYSRALKLGIINKSDKLPHHYRRMFFVYQEERDIKGRAVVKEELYEGSQKRFIYWVPGWQK